MNTGRTLCAAALRLVAIVLVAATSPLIVSCFSLGRGGESEAYEDYGYMAADEGGSGSGAPAPEPMAAAERSLAVDVGATGSTIPVTSDTTVPAGEATEETTPAERLRVYSADLELVVPSVETSRDDIIGIVESEGGYVESSRADYLVVRVPAARFDSILETIEGVGDVRSRAVRTADVTEQFLDLERRLQISEASRDRLLGLLEQTEDPEERVAILRDIRRLTEEIEQLRSSLESLDQLIRFSRITIQLISRIQVSQIARQEIPFWWIASLEPLGMVGGSAAVDIPIVPDDSFAVFATGRSLFAEAADGTQFRAGAVANEPRGDEVFWQAALSHHLRPFYRAVTEISAGDYRGVMLESKDSDPFYYMVVVHSRDDELIVAEVFLPSGAAKDTRLGKIRDAIAGGVE